jgi:uncharacterized membrane protein YqjE
VVEVAEPQRLYPKREEPIGNVVQELISDVRDLMRDEIKLARAEMSESVGNSISAAVMLGIGGALAFLGVAYLLLAGVFALATIFAPWLAALIVGGVVLLIGAIVLLLGRNRLQQVKVVPDETIETLKEDQEWLTRQRR